MLPFLNIANINFFPYHQESNQFSNMNSKILKISQDKVTMPFFVNSILVLSGPGASVTSEC